MKIILPRYLKLIFCSKKNPIGFHILLIFGCEKVSMIQPRNIMVRVNSPSTVLPKANIRPWQVFYDFFGGAVAKGAAVHSVPVGTVGGLCGAFRGSESLPGGHLPVPSALWAIVHRPARSLGGNARQEINPPLW